VTVTPDPTGALFVVGTPPGGAGVPGPVTVGALVAETAGDTVAEGELEPPATGPAGLEHPDRIAANTPNTTTTISPNRTDHRR